MSEPPQFAATGSNFPAGMSIVLLLGSLITGFAWYRVLDRTDWVTGARRVTWKGPAGDTINRNEPGNRYPWNGCESVDVGLDALFYDGGLWAFCAPHRGFPGGAYGRIDPARGEGRIDWPLPASAPGASTVGLVPGPNGQLGIVYLLKEVNGQVAAGIAGREGWVREPEVLPGDSDTWFLGAAWVRDALEVVVRPGSGSIEATTFAMPVVVRLDASSRSERRPFADREAFCPAATGHCGPVTMAFRANQEDGWLFPVEASPEGRQAALWQISESGTSRESRWATDPFMISEHVDNVAFGVLKQPVFLHDPDRKSFVLTPGGELEDPAPTPPGWRSAVWGTFTTWHGHLSRNEHWLSDDGTFAVGREVGDRFLVTRSTEKQPGNRLVISDQTDPTQPRDEVVARAASYSCGELTQGVFLPRAEGGYWLATSSGCYLALDASLRRADPLGVREHLRRRGSIGMDWNEWWHAWLLGLVLLGLPICVAAGVGAGWLVSRRRTQTEGRWLARAIAISAWVFVVAGGYALLRILPLLG